jgi:hypothetical protein
MALSLDVTEAADLELAQSGTERAVGDRGG